MYYENTMISVVFLKNLYYSPFLLPKTIPPFGFFCIFAKKIGFFCDFVAVFREPGYRKSRLDRIWRAERQRVNE